MHQCKTLSIPSSQEFWFLISEKKQKSISRSSFPMSGKASARYYIPSLNGVGNKYWKSLWWPVEQNSSLSPSKNTQGAISPIITIVWLTRYDLESLNLKNQSQCLSLSFFIVISPLSILSLLRNYSFNLTLF